MDGVAFSGPHVGLSICSVLVCGVKLEMVELLLNNGADLDPEYEMAPAAEAVVPDDVP